MPNLGSFSAGQPDVRQAVQQAIEARQQGGQPMSPMSQGATSQPQPMPQAMGQAVPQMGGQPQQAGQAEMPLDAQSQEAQLIVKAMAERLKTLGKIQMPETLSPSQSQRPTAPMAAPVGGGASCYKRR